MAARAKSDAVMPVPGRIHENTGFTRGMEMLKSYAGSCHCGAVQSKPI